MERQRFEQVKQILDEVSRQIQLIQKDNSNVFDVVNAFEKIRNSWKNNPGLSDDRKLSLESIFKQR